MASTQPHQRDHQTVAPALIVRSAAKAIGFYTAAFGAGERMAHGKSGWQAYHARGTHNRKLNDLSER